MSAQNHRGSRRTVLRGIAASAIAGCGLPWAVEAAADPAYPNRPIRFIIPFPPGSGTEVSARFFGRKLSELTGQPVVIEPKGGGNGLIGVHAALSAPRDGYTLFFGSSSTLATNVALLKKMPYDPLVDFVPISLTMRSPVLILVPAASPYKTLKDVIDAAKREPGKLTVATGSPHYQMVATLLAEKAGVQMQNIPYKSSPDAAKAVAGSEVMLGVADVTSAMPLVAGNHVRPLAVIAEKRLTGAPEIPTAIELGLRDFTHAPWNGLVAPAGVPKEIVDKLSDLFVRIAAMPDTQEYYARQNVELMRPGQAAMRAFQREEIELWKSVAQTAKIELQ